MRVVYLHPFTQELSGPDESLLALLAELVPLGVEAHLVIPAVTPLADRYRALGVSLHVQPLTILNRGMTRAELALYGPRVLARAVRLARLLRRLGADLVHTNMEVLLEGALAARLLRLPHVLHYRGNSLDSPRLLFDALTRLWTGLADHVYCISAATAEIFRRRGRAAKVEVLYNPVTLATFAVAGRSDEVRASLGAGPADRLVVSVGRLHPRKDIATFLRAAAAVGARLPEARFAVVGAAAAPVEVEYERELRALAAGLGLAGRLLFAGARRDVPAVMKAADLLVLSSRHEGFGRVVAEAMAAGTPVVGTREGALPELLDEPRAGLCAAPGDAGDFASRILDLLGDHARRQSVTAAAHQRAELFDAARTAARVHGRYRALLAGARSPSSTASKRASARSSR
jgi:glycosyltransferase involved in cell wall biosynthesis